MGKSRSVRVGMVGVAAAVIAAGAVLAWSVAPPAHGRNEAARIVGGEYAECWIHLVNEHPARPIVGPWWIEAVDQGEFSVRGFGQGYEVQIGDGQLIARSFSGHFAFAQMSDCDPARRSVEERCQNAPESVTCRDPADEH